MDPPRDAGAFDRWDLVRSSLAGLNAISSASNIWWTRRAGRSAVDAVSRARFQSLVQFARARSRFYREALGGLSERDITPGMLPVTTKRQLMARFDDWVTDPKITRTGIETFLDSRENIGRRYLDRYLVWKSSGTGGEPGIFVQDPAAIATYDALMSVQLEASNALAGIAFGFAAHGGRAALVIATGDHFAGIASWRRAIGANPWLAGRSFSVLDPLPDIVRALNAWQPAFIASYPTALSLLADEQSAGRLRTSPACLWSGGECVAPHAKVSIERAFGCPLLDEYGASEALSIAFGCREGWLHVNADWMALEPVDRDYQPTPEGLPSHTVLLTNLANRVQPVIRYDLGDSVIARASPCPCGNPLPAILVEGRRDDVLSMAAPDGTRVRLLPIALVTIVEEAIGMRRFQIVQIGVEDLALRLPRDRSASRLAEFVAVSAALRRYLAWQSLTNVRVSLAEEPPLPDKRSGKLREVVALTAPDAASH
jgi:phenylacetate-coenzyme A ligase PaaK-like adenylate-forming protein